MPLAIAQMAKSSSYINLWEINSSNDLTTVYKRKIQLPIENTNNSFEHFNGTFDSDGLLHIVQSNGRIWHVRFKLIFELIDSN